MRLQTLGYFEAVRYHVEQGSGEHIKEYKLVPGLLLIIMRFEQRLDDLHFVVDIRRVRSNDVRSELLRLRSCGVVCGVWVGSECLLFTSMFDL